jgi:hypothetical protein
MYILHNDQLEIQIIDPIKDRKLLGSRYCTGGYIYQIRDLKKGDLLSGPEYPKPDFNVFNGQGAPEVFLTPLNEQAAVGDDLFVLGVGIVQRTSPISPFHVRDNPVVREFCLWEVEELPHTIKMTSRSVFNQWDFCITRLVSLNYRTISSETIFFNNSESPIPIVWFAHPFFPFPIDYKACSFTAQINLPENSGYFVNNQGFIELKNDYKWKKGLYQKVAYPINERLCVIQNHPVIGNVKVTGDFIPESIAIWANNITFSFEPFYNKFTGHNEKCSLKLSYCF